MKSFANNLVLLLGQDFFMETSSPHQVGLIGNSTHVSWQSHQHQLRSVCCAAAHTVFPCGDCCLFRILSYLCLSAFIRIMVMITLVPPSQSGD